MRRGRGRRETLPKKLTKREKRKSILSIKASQMSLEYYYNEEPMPLAHITLRSMKEDLPYVKDHIILVGSLRSIYQFILPLRAKYLGFITVRR